MIEGTGSQAFSNRTNSSQEKVEESQHQHNTGMIFSLLKRMNPGLCLCGETVADTDSFTYDEFCRTKARLESTITSILMEINEEEKENYTASSTSAFEKLHELSKTSRNRIPLVCSSKWDIISSLANRLHSNMARLSSEAEGQSEQHVTPLICLTLVNLSIPHENKNAMVHGPHANLLLGSITAVINMMVPEATYLCCIILMNLSFLPDTAEPILIYSSLFQCSPSCKKMDMSTNGGRDWDAPHTFQSVTQYHPVIPRQRRSTSHWRCLDDPNSLIRSLERLIRDKQPFLMSKAFSVEGEGIRWAIGLLRNLTLKSEHCSIIAKTEIPALVLGILERTPHQAIKWTNESTEDMTLTVLENLAASSTSREMLIESGALLVLRSIQTGLGGEVVRYKISCILDLLQNERMNE